MTPLATNATHVAEYEARMLTLTDAATGRAWVFTGAVWGRDFKACLKTHGADRAITTYLRLAPQHAVACKMYKAGVLAPYLVADHG